MSAGNIHRGGNGNPKERPGAELDPVAAARSEQVQAAANNVAMFALAHNIFMTHLPGMQGRIIQRRDQLVDGMVDTAEDRAAAEVIAEAEAIVRDAAASPGVVATRANLNAA